MLDFRKTVIATIRTNIKGLKCMLKYNQPLRYRHLDILYYGPAPLYIPIATIATYCEIPIILRTQRETKLACRYNNNSFKVIQPDTYSQLLTFT